MEHEEEMLEFSVITLPMDDGTEQEFAIMDEFEFNGSMYMVVSAVNGDEIEDDMFLYRFREDGDDLIVDYIDDEEEYAAAVAAYEELCELEDDEDGCECGCGCGDDCGCDCE